MSAIGQKRTFASPMMLIRIRDSDHARELRASIDVEMLRADMKAVGDAALLGRPEQEVSDAELTLAFERASPNFERKYGLDIWDAMILLAPDSDESRPAESEQTSSP